MSALLEEQFHLQTNAQRMQFTRFTSPGSAANYAERYLRLETLMSEDLKDAYIKLYSVARGIQSVLQMTTISAVNNRQMEVDIPVLDSTQAIAAWVLKVAPVGDSAIRRPDVLDALVYWCRNVMRELDRIGQYETEVVIPLSLTQAGTSPPVLADLPTALKNGSGKVTFTLRADQIPYYSRFRTARVTGIGISVEHDIDDSVPIQFTKNFPRAAESPVPGGAWAPREDDPAQAKSVRAEALMQIRTARLIVIVSTPEQIGTALPATRGRQSASRMYGSSEVSVEIWSQT